MAAPPGACAVLVVGLGPVGLLLTALLRAQGCDVLAVEREPVPSDEPRAAVLDDEALRALQAAGAAGAVVGEGIVQERADLRLGRDRSVTLMRFAPRTANGQPGLVGLHQPRLEARLGELVAPVAHRGWEVTGLDDRGSGVEVTLRGLADGAVRTVRAGHVAGCDGASSAVRRLAGIEYHGTTSPQRWLVTDAAVEDPGARRVTFTGDPAAPAVTLPLTEGLRRWEVMVGAATEVDAELAERLVRTGGGVPVRTAVYAYHARIAARWRTGNVLLAGDAAHVMPPFAGQGLGAGLRDAVNLAWKLAAVAGGRASPALLDSYETERRRHVVQMTALARFVGAIVQTRRGRLAAARDRTLLALDGTPLAGRLQDGAAKPRATLRHGALDRSSRGAGALLPQPDVELGEGTRAPLDDVLGRGWSLVSRKPIPPAAPAIATTLVLGRDVSDPSGALDGWLRRHGAVAALVRPDRHVGATAPTAHAAAELRVEALLAGR